MKQFLLSTLTLITLVLVSCAQGNGEKKVLNAKAFSETLTNTPGALVLDVRTADEFAGGHLEKAVNVDWNGNGFEAWSQKIDKDASIFAYCLSGGRSGSAGQFLREKGFKNVVEMEGGLMKWKAAGLPLAGENPGKKGMQIADYEKLLLNDKIVLVDFYAPWCGPCKKMKPELEKLEMENSAKLKVIRIDSDENPDLAKALGVDALPMVFIYKAGKQFAKLEGYQSPEQLKKAAGL
jgi:thioredoxin